MQLWGRNTSGSQSLAPVKSAETKVVLRELFELLEDYAPTWYTEELHNRAASALGELQPAI